MEWHSSLFKNWLQKYTAQGQESSSNTEAVHCSGGHSKAGFWTHCWTLSTAESATSVPWQSWNLTDHALPIVDFKHICHCPSHGVSASVHCPFKHQVPPLFYQWAQPLEPVPLHLCMSHWGTQWICPTRIPSSAPTMLPSSVSGPEAEQKSNQFSSQ